MCICLSSCEYCSISGLHWKLKSSQALCTVWYCQQVSVFGKYLFMHTKTNCILNTVYMFWRNCASYSNLAAHMFHGRMLKFPGYYVLLDLTSLFNLQDIGSVRWLHAQKAQGLVDTQDNYEQKLNPPGLLRGSAQDTVRYRQVVKLKSC